MAGTTGKTWIIPKRGDGSLWMSDVFPLLSSPNVTSIAQTTVTARVTCSRSGGTLYLVVTQSATAPTIAQIKAGQDHLGAAAVRAMNQAVSTSGVRSFAVSSLVAGQSYYAHFVHNASSLDSNVASTVQWTQASAAQATWQTIPNLAVNRSLAFPQTALTNVRATYLSNPGGVTVSSVQLLNVSVAQVTYNSATDQIVITADPGSDVVDSVAMRAVTPGGNVDSNAFSISITVIAPTWDQIPDQLSGPTYPHDLGDVTQWINDPGGIVNGYVVEDVSPGDLVSSGLLTLSPTRRLIVTGDPGTPNPPKRFRLGADYADPTSQGAEADWLARTSGENVVWFHDFRSDSEVNNFRYSTGTSGGVDPGALATPTNGGRMGAWLRRNTSDFITGSGCLESYRGGITTAGTITGLTSSTESSAWRRPTAPLFGAGNGRGVDDPAANNTLTRRTYTPVQGGTDEIAGFGNAGTYGHADYHSTWPGMFDGTEYWLQFRYKIDPRRWLRPENAAVGGGKIVIISNNYGSNNGMKIVVESAKMFGGDAYFEMYANQGGDAPMNQQSPGTSVHGNQPWTEYVPPGGSVGSNALCNLSDARVGNCWQWPEGGGQGIGVWMTLMFHCRPGHGGVADSCIEVLAAIPPETTFTRIWNQGFASTKWPLAVNSKFTLNNPGGTDDTARARGHNGLDFSTYHNGSVGSGMSEFWQRYTQIIFSKAAIACPNDPVQRGEI